MEVAQIEGTPKSSKSVEHDLVLKPMASWWLLDPHLTNPYIHRCSMDISLEHVGPRWTRPCESGREGNRFLAIFGMENRWIVQQRLGFFAQHSRKGLEAFKKRQEWIKSSKELQNWPILKCFVCACVFPEEHVKEMVTQATNTRRTHRFLQNKNNSIQYVQQRLEKMWGWWVGKYINVLLDTFKIKHCIETQYWAGGFPILKGHTISPICLETDRQFKIEYNLFFWCEYMNMYEHDTRLWMLLWPSRKKRKPITQVDTLINTFRIKH